MISACDANLRALASVLTGRGWQLTASDRRLRAPAAIDGTRVRISPGHSPRFLPADCDVCVFSPGVPPVDCERHRAEQLGITLVSYPQMLAHLMHQQAGLAIAGTRGKSMVGAMAAEILIRAGLDPTVLIGGAPMGWHTGGRPGSGRYLLAEAPHEQGGFLELAPHVAVLLNLEAGDSGHFRSMEHLESLFARFVGQVASDGFVLVRSGCSRLEQVCADATARVVRFGFERTDTWRAVGVDARDGYYRFEVWKSGRRFAGVRLAVPGRHQVENALAAIALAGEMDIGPDLIQVALEEFRGVRRRFEVIGTIAGVRIVDDYAHHPTSVAAALAAAREVYGGGRLICALAPQPAIRLPGLVDALARSLQNADSVLVSDICRWCGLATEPESAAEALVERIRAQGGQAETAGSCEELLRRLEREIRPGDVVAFLGADEVGKIQHAFVERLRRNCAS